MSLIKCNNCGRPYYDSEIACPFCGHATNLSSNNRVTKTLSDQKSREMMEAFFAGDLHQPEVQPVHRAPIIPKEEPVAMENPAVEQEPAEMPEPNVVEPETIAETEPAVESEPVVEPESVVESEPVVEPEPEPEPEKPSDAVLGRAESIAAATNVNANIKEETIDDEPFELETTLPRNKRHIWLWFLIILLLLGIAAVVYLKWDLLYDKVSSIIA